MGKEVTATVYCGLEYRNVKITLGQFGVEVIMTRLAFAQLMKKMVFFLQIELLLTSSMRATKSLTKVAADRTYRRQTA